MPSCPGVLPLIVVTAGLLLASCSAELDPVEGDAEEPTALQQQQLER